MTYCFSSMCAMHTMHTHVYYVVLCIPQPVCIVVCKLYYYSISSTIVCILYIALLYIVVCICHS